MSPCVRTGSVSGPETQPQGQGAVKLAELSMVDEKNVRFWARKLANKSFGILKLCKVVLEENEILVKEIPKKTKLKDDLEWSQSVKRKYTLWKTANIKFLNLKESTLKVKEQENELVKFWEVKGGKKVKENWEKDAEAAANEK